ncbi:hypothetical protein [Photobacterium leiognathi]|uniref:hypothetical protein n=1 Tax=Photobacterium leiognathi TaxID=553611 RepID=UPI0029826C2B|nr:hypothetical protein [Photobacterium leiognathi]
MKKSTALSRVLLSLNDFVLSLSDDEIEKINSGEYYISHKINKSKPRKTEEIKSKISEIDCHAILSDLESVISRSQGRDLIDYYLKNKAQLELFAKYIDVAVMRSDKVDKIKENIIESTVGAKLRSQAIQGKEI